jgi:dipeptidyl aminopeptidase/acylaminoacyl peptidase
MQTKPVGYGVLSLLGALAFLIQGSRSAPTPSPEATAPAQPAQARPASAPAPAEKLTVTFKPDPQELRVSAQRAGQLAGKLQGRVFKAKVTPNWFADNTKFWYRNDLRGGDKEFILVDAEQGTRRPAFDHEKLAAGLSKAAGGKYQARRLPFDTIEFLDAGKAVRFRAGEAAWRCDLTSYECVKTNEPAPDTSAAPPAPADEAAEERPEDDTDTPGPQADEEPQKGKKGKGGKRFPPLATREAPSPDGRWTALVKDSNIVLRDKDGKETPLTRDGAIGNAYGWLSWSPDSKTLVGYRTESGDNKQVYMIETSPRDQLPAKLHQRGYPRPGDRFDAHEMWLIEVGTRKPVKADIERIDTNPTRVPPLRWKKDGRHFTFERADRGHQRFRLIEVDAHTGKGRTLLDEKSATFLWTVHPPRLGLLGVAVRYLAETEELLYVSQRDGWKHLYLVDAQTGKFKNQITKGPWVVRKIDRVDEAKRQIWFRASGKNPDQDPYLVHHYRVNFDGTGLVALTEGNGNHEVSFSPDEKYLIDSYSRVDMAPVTELRRTADGKLVCALEKADVSALEQTGWRYPEVFTAKARDGQTDIWGVVYRPANFDPKKKYPIIEAIYAGPHDSHVPKIFAAYRPLQSLAEMGFMVVQIDGMGTANRSRAFHDVCWKNLADAGFPDRILWIKSLAKRYPYMDTERVGIFGTSAGGQNALGALLFHGYFYKVGVAACGCHDNRLDKYSWNEQWMGLMGPHYEAQSNATNAHKLTGKLLLIVGELDTNVPFESTMRVVDALVRARKTFDLLVVPGMGHSSGGAYGEMLRRDFFVRHLHGVEPPDRNAAQARAQGE